MKILEIEYKQQEKNIGNFTNKYWEGNLNNCHREITKWTNNMEKLDTEKKALQNSLKDLYCQLEANVDKEREENEWKDYQQQFKRNQEQCQSEIIKNEEILSQWNEHFILDMSEKNPMYLEWMPCFGKKTKEEWKEFYQPFLSQDKLDTVSLNELYKTLSNYPEERLDESILEYYDASLKEEKVQWFESFDPQQNANELKLLYCNLSHSMEDLNSDDYYQKKVHEYERQLAIYTDQFQIKKTTYDSLFKISSFWKKHCFDFYWKQHEMFSDDKDYKMYSPTKGDSKQWASFYENLCSCRKDYDYKSEMDKLSTYLKTLYESLPSFHEPVCSTSEYLEKVSWLKN